MMKITALGAAVGIVGLLHWWFAGSALSLWLSGAAMGIAFCSIALASMERCR